MDSQTKIIETRYGYICTTTWDWEVGSTSVVVYDSVKKLKAATKCTTQCGYVRIKMEVVKSTTGKGFV